MRKVQLRDARATLSALVEKAAHGEAAVITRRGKPRAVILGIEEWNRLRTVPSFGRLLLSAPLEDADLPPRDTTPMRDAALQARRHVSGGYQRAVGRGSGPARTAGCYSWTGVPINPNDRWSHGTDAFQPD